MGQTRLSVIINSDAKLQFNGLMQPLTTELFIQTVKEMLPNHAISEFIDTNDHDRLTILITDKHNG